MKFSLFRKPKQQAEPENAAVPPEEPKEETTAVSEEPKQEATAPQQPAPAQETVVPPQEPKQEAAETINKTYLKAMPLKELTDIDNVKNEVKNGNIIILRVTPLANKSIDDVKNCRKPALRIRRIRRRRHCTLGGRASGYLSKKYSDLARKNAGF